MANTGYVNEDVRKMYGIPYSQLTDEQKRILHADSIRRAKLIAEREQAVLKNNLKAFDDEARLERVLASIYRDTQKQILADVAETIAKVQKAGGTWSYANQSALTRSRGLFEQITAELTKLGQKEQIAFAQGLSNIYTDQFLRQVYELGQSIPVKANFNRLNPALIKQTLDYPWSGAMFSDRLWLDKETLGRNLRVGLTQSMILGESIPQITDRINKNIDTARYNAERVVRTETKRVTYVAHDHAYADMGVEELEYRCANGGDSRTCSTCKADNGKKYKRGNEPTLPRHPNCRCVYIPVVSDTFGDNELNELTGSVRGAENYEKWRKAQEEKLQKEKEEKAKSAGTTAKKNDKYDMELERLDSEYKAKNMEITTIQADYDSVDAKYRSYSKVRRGFDTPEEEGFKNMAEFEAMDKALSKQLTDLQTKLQEAQVELKDIARDRQYLLKVGAEMVDSLPEYQYIRGVLKKSTYFDYDKYGDELLDVLAKMDAENIALQRAYYENGCKTLWTKYGLTPAEVFKEGAISDTRVALKYVHKVEYREVQKFTEAITEDEIIARLGGGDLTQGSCSSLAFSYAGNKNGLDVLDYRDGDSRYFFSLNGNTVEISKLPKVISYIEENTSDVKGALALLKKMEDGKEYYLATGSHASIVRKVGAGYEYLELQTVNSNGFKPLTTDVLKRRFGCKMSHTFHGRKYASKSELIEVSSLGNSEEFRKILGYMNTETYKQKKGSKGYAK